MSLDLSKLGPAEQVQLASLLGKLQDAGMSSAKAQKQARRRPAQRIKYMTEEELKRFFEVVRKPPAAWKLSAWQTARDYAMFRVAYHRGLRAREVGRIQLDDYRVRDDRLRFDRSKGSKGGEYHLVANEVRALRAWLRQRGTAPGPLFPSKRGAGISQQMLDVLMKRYGAAAGIPREKCHSHALKHSCGTHLMDRGETLDDVQDLLGHVSSASTRVYAQYTDKRRSLRDKRLRDW